MATKTTLALLGDSKGGSGTQVIVDAIPNNLHSSLMSRQLDWTLVFLYRIFLILVVNL